MDLSTCQTVVSKILTHSGGQPASLEAQVTVLLGTKLSFATLLRLIADAP